MNYTTAVFLINKNLRAIQTRYNTPEEIASGKSRSVTEFITFKTLDPNVKVGDLVIVPTKTRYKMTVVKVSAVDVDVDFDSSIKMDWIIGTVDATQYEKTLSEEAAAIAAIKSAETRKKREELRQSLFKDNLETLKALPIAALNGDATATS